MGNMTVLKKIITPNDQVLRDVFSRPRSYFIDIYQREYRWSKENVLTLLSDIEINFLQQERLKDEPKEIQADVLENFEPYFLNTYLTHTTSASIYIVDGQQRLTTFLLMFINLYQIVKVVEENGPGKTFSSKTLEDFIFERNDFGEASRFKIYNENREVAFRALIDGCEIKAVDETQKRIIDNYKTISGYYDGFFRDSKDPKQYNIKLITYYISYLLDRISLVEIKIEKQKNVAMIFEVVNDRGLGLKPYEILKGKLIGNLSSYQKERANIVWTELQDLYFNAVVKHSTEASIDLDTFFQTYFRAKFADSESDYDKFESNYHYEVYRNEGIRKYFSEFKDMDALFRVITEDINYFARLYLYLRTTYDNEFLIYNKLLDQNQQYLLIMSNVSYNDIHKDEKITLIAKKFDQMHAVLRLLNVYESAAFQDLIYPLNRDLRNKALGDVSQHFDNSLIGYLEKENIIAQGKYNETKEIFEFDRFKGISNRWLNFSKYTLMRIDRWLAGVLDKPSYVSERLEELEERFNKNNRRRYGLHLEHIYTWHSKNIDIFSSSGIFDEQGFNQTRNLLGMVLLLKDNQNISSNNEIYQNKVKTYSQSNFIWNEILAGHLHNVDLHNLPSDLKVGKIDPTPDGIFPSSKTNDRQMAVFNAIKHIWGNF